MFVSLFLIHTRERLLLVNPSSSTITKQLVALVVGQSPSLISALLLFVQYMYTCTSPHVHVYQQYLASRYIVDICTCTWICSLLSCLGGLVVKAPAMYNVYTCKLEITGSSPTQGSSGLFSLK